MTETEVRNRKQWDSAHVTTFLFVQINYGILRKAGQRKKKKNSRRSPLDMQLEASRWGIASALGKAFIFSLPLQIKVYTL